MIDPKKLERAKALEKAGKHDAAFAAYRELGAIDDAGRVLSTQRRYAEAGQLLFESLGVEPRQAGQLEPLLKKRALMAAICFGRAGENALAVELFLGLGERARAAEVLERAGDKVGAAKIAAGRAGQFEGVSLAQAPKQASAVGGQALSAMQAQRLEQSGKMEAAFDAYVQLKKFADGARVAHALGRTADAAQLYADAGMPYEAAGCYLELGDTGKTLDNLVRVPRAEPRYRQAAIDAVRMAGELKVLTFQLEHFLGPFVATGPQSDRELDAFYALAHLYRAHDFLDSAKEALHKIVKKRPGYRDVEDMLRDLEEETRPSTAVARQVLADGDARGVKGPRAAAPAMPELPDLDDAPMTIMQMRSPTDPGALAAPGTTQPVGLRKSVPDAPAPLRSTNPAEALVTQPPGPDLPDADVVLDDLEPLPATTRVPVARGAEFAVGQIIAQRYKLEQKIGQGGMAAVFRAQDLELEEQVALKVFGLQQTSDVLVARFKQELKLSRQLIHPNIIRLYDIGIYDGHRYISMELLVGQTLKDRMERPMEFLEALGYLIQICAGLQAAHDAGVIHRDVKPDNFFIAESGQVKVMDFGIAKQFAAPGVTVAGSIAGTPLYMSPEQIGNFSSVTHLTDVYALGVTAYEMFTGTVPFSHPDLVPLLMMHVNTPPEAPCARNPGVPEDLEQVILKCLAKDPKDRFQSCRELGAALSAVRARFV